MTAVRPGVAPPAAGQVTERGSAARATVGDSGLVVVPLDELGADALDQWTRLHAEHGTRVQQAPAYARALARAGHRVLVVTGNDLVAALTDGGDGLATTVCPDTPVLSDRVADPDQLIDVLSAVRRHTGGSVYAPLVGEALSGAAAHEGLRVWDRPPNSVLDWSDRGAGLWDRVVERGSSQVVRKRRLVERDGLALETGRSGSAAAREMLEVDDRSWKAQQGQSMRQRSQAMLYGELVTVGALRVSFLRDGTRPVAFRLDSQVGGRLTCLKWSYDEAYKRYSPGLHLLTAGLVLDWADSDVATVDLFGGPDSLKNLLYSERVPRIDVWHGDRRRAEELASEREAFDERVASVQEQGRGLRHAYH